MNGLVIAGAGSWCEAIDMKIIFFYSHANKTHFHNKGFAISFVLKVRDFGTRKWLISLVSFERNSLAPVSF